MKIRRLSPDRCSENQLNGQNKASIHQMAKWQDGQIVVEYVLLLIVAVILASMIVFALVHRSRNGHQNDGVVIKAWSGLVNFVACDLPDSAQAGNACQKP